MKSVIFGAIILLFACVFIARAARADSPSANCWAIDGDGFQYPVPAEVKCYDTPAQAKAAALTSCKKHSPVKASCRVLTCGWCE